MFMKFEDIVVISLMTLGKQQISKRAERVFCYYGMNNMSEDQMQQIFESLCLAFLRIFTGSIKSCIQVLIKQVIRSYNKISQQLQPTPSKAFYIFTTKDLWRLFMRSVSCSPHYLDNVDIYYRFVYHEMLRVFQDRLVSDKD
jgi:dynein heavy chain, axonemal